MNDQVREDQDCWLDFINDRHAGNVLLEASAHLKWAWKTDKKDPNSYPINTGELFFEINKRIAQGSRGGSPRKTMPRVPHPPERFSDLLDEKIIKAVFEEQNNGSYDSALKLAASSDREGDAGRRADSAWRKIMRAVNTAYFINFYGMGFIPKPRVHFLHRELLKVAKRVGLKKLKLIAQFLNRLCPCGERHMPETIGRLRRRSSGKRPARR